MLVGQTFLDNSILYTIEKANQLHQSPYWVKQELLTRTVTSVALPALVLLATAYHSVKTSWNLVKVAIKTGMQKTAPQKYVPFQHLSMWDVKKEATRVSNFCKVFWYSFSLSKQQHLIDVCAYDSRPSLVKSLFSSRFAWMTLALGVIGGLYLFSNKFSFLFNKCAHQDSFEGKSPHDTLGLNSNASEKEIRKARNILAMQYHPDKCTKEEAECCATIFRNITNAYEELTGGRFPGLFGGTELA